MTSLNFKYLVRVFQAKGQGGQFFLLLKHIIDMGDRSYGNKASKNCLIISQASCTFPANLRIW